MLIRISLIVAIIAGLGVGALNFIKVRDSIITLQTHLKEETEAHRKFEADARATHTKLTKTEADLKQTQSDLATSNDEKNKAQAEAAAQSRRASQLTDELGKTKSELGESQAELQKYHASGRSPEEVLALNRTLKETQSSLAGAQEENALLGKKLLSVKAQLAIYMGSNAPVVYLPPTLKGKVTVADPKWEFVIVDVGETQGVLQDGELLVSRNGQLVAKVIVRTVEKDRSIANVMPGFKIGEVMEGDVVVPAHPQS